MTDHVICYIRLKFGLVDLINTYLDLKIYDVWGGVFY